MLVVWLGAHVVCRQAAMSFSFANGSVKEGLRRGLAEAPAALMRSSLIVFDDPSVEIGLQLVDGSIDFLAERHPVELVEHGAMEALADAVGLRALGLGAAVVDVLDREIELIFVAFAAAKLGATIGQHARQANAVLVVEREGFRMPARRKRWSR